VAGNGDQRRRRSFDVIMPLDRDTYRYRKSQADRIIRDLLVNRVDPSGACMSQKIAEVVFPESDEMSNRQWGSAIGYCKRVMGAIRQRAYNAIETEGKKPTFFPFPFPFSVPNGNGKKEVFWAYFNATEEPWYSRAVKRMRGAADGLNNAAQLLESVSNNGNDDDGRGGEQP
jgi:hypothetical protein